jgi:hypothetical protein
MKPKPSNLRHSFEQMQSPDDAPNSSKFRRTLEECEDLDTARAKRKERDDDEMYQGLMNFKGRQRGWNGERESDRQQTIRSFHDTENAKSQARVEKERATSDHPPAMNQHVSLQDLRDGSQQVRIVQCPHETIESLLLCKACTDKRSSRF